MQTLKFIGCVSLAVSCVCAPWRALLPHPIFVAQLRLSPFPAAQERLPQPEPPELDVMPVLRHEPGQSSPAAPALKTTILRQHAQPHRKARSVQTKTIVPTPFHLRQRTRRK